jgi:AcrR family transcriptional regulator
MTLDSPPTDRTARRRGATRREILEAAWEVARADGWEGLTLRKVADRVGMRAPSLYSHFDSKAAIIDAMYGEAWAELDEHGVRLESELPEDPREVLMRIGEMVLGYFTADAARHALMNLTPVPGFQPSEEAYAHAVRNLDRLRAQLRSLGVTDEGSVDLWTGLIGGLANQQVSNDPGGDRWTRLLPRAVEMYADHVGLPATPKTSS